MPFSGNSTFASLCEFWLSREDDCNSKSTLSSSPRLDSDTKSSKAKLMHPGRETWLALHVIGCSPHSGMAIGGGRCSRLTRLARPASLVQPIPGNLTVFLHLTSQYIIWLNGYAFGPIANRKTTATMAEGSTNGSGEHSPPSQKRQRAKQACEPCRLRKRRCDGNMPCNMCTQFEYKCYFEKHPRKRSKLVEQDAVENGIIQASPTRNATPPHEEQTTQEDVSKMQSMEANSGMAFTKLLGMRLDASAGPKLFTFGWNLGTGSTSAPISSPITGFLTQDQMIAMAKFYFTNAHPLYGILDKEWLMKQIMLRYSSQKPVQCPDHLMAGVAALGTLFGDGSIDTVLPGLVDSAKLSLESTSTMQPPTIYDVQSWILRTIYLRSTGHPHACWMASSVTMHLIESCGLQQESTSSVMYPPTNDHMNDAEVRRRTFWIARLLNTWISFEYGRNRVALRGITCKLPVHRDGDFTREYIELYSISCCLDPENADKPTQWEDFLRQLEQYDAPHDCMELSRANLGLCAYRRLRLGNPNLPSETINRITAIGLAGLQAARNQANKGMPWWHVANVPFQCICVFLAIDTKESLSHIGTAMRTLEMVVKRFDTVAMKEALKTARFLVRLSKKKKDEDSDVLEKSLKRDSADGDAQPDGLQPLLPKSQNNPSQPMQQGQQQQPLMNQMQQSQQQPQPQQQQSLQQPIMPMVDEQQQLMWDQGPLTTSSGEDWNMDYLNNTDFDWNFFLSQDIPAFQNLAPDGMM